MSRIRTLVSSSVGKKIIMGSTGILLVVFVLGHMAGNLKAFQGAEHFNAYAEFLRSMGSPLVPHGFLLWIVRIGLVVITALHIISAIQLTLQARTARPVKYQRAVHLEDTYASRTMRWGGVILAVFVTYHLLHLTVGSVHTDFQVGDAYHNLVAGFQAPPIAALYAVAVIMLGFHLYHGIWSAFQTLGFYPRRYARLQRGVASLVGVVVVVGYLTIPVAIMTGILR